jgi:hypothetical protein
MDLLAVYVWKCCCSTDSDRARQNGEDLVRNFLAKEGFKFMITVHFDSRDKAWGLFVYD